MAVEVLPAVRGADEPAAEVLEWPAGGKAQRESPAARVSHSVIDPGTVVTAGAAEVWRENEHEPIAAVKSEAHEQYVAQRVRQQLEGERREAGARREQPVTALPLQIDPAAVADQIEPQIADLRLARRGPIDLVHDAVSDGGPKPRAAEGGGHKILVARAPGGRDPRGAESLIASCDQIHWRTASAGALDAQPRSNARDFRLPLRDGREARIDGVLLMHERVAMSSRRSQHERGVAFRLRLDHAGRVPEHGDLLPVDPLALLQLQTAVVDREPGDVVPVGRHIAPALPFLEPHVKVVDVCQDVTDAAARLPELSEDDPHGSDLFNLQRRDVLVRFLGARIRRG